MPKEIEQKNKDKIIFVGGNLQKGKDIEITARYEPLETEYFSEGDGCQEGSKCQMCQIFLFKKIIQLPKQRIAMEFGTNYKKTDQENIYLESREVERICYCGCCKVDD